MSVLKANDVPFNVNVALAAVPATARDALPGPEILYVSGSDAPLDCFNTNAVP